MSLTTDELAAIEKENAVWDFMTIELQSLTPEQCINATHAEFPDIADWELREMLMILQGGDLVQVQNG